MSTQGTSTYWCAHAALPGGMARDVAVGVAGGRVTSVVADSPVRGTVLDGVVVPGMANGHSHAFHRALRGRTHRDRGSFWTWRESMYALSARLDPETYYRLARAVYGEMVASGFTSVGEFHYLHHAPGGSRYDDPNAMSHALLAAAADAGIRITLLDTCYLSGGFGAPCDDAQLRFSDGDVESWTNRTQELARDIEGGGCPGTARIGAAIHSVRAVPADAARQVAAWAADRSAPLHMHVSEQRKENEDCASHYGQTPVEVLGAAGALGERAVAVHATHLTDGDRGLLASTGTRACFCPTTERDLGDGIGAAAALAADGVGLCLGSDSHAVVDPFEEMRALEMNERLSSQRRGHFSASELLHVGADHAAIGWGDVGGIAPGSAADLVVLNPASARTAGAEPDAVPLVASSPDVTRVIVAGRELVSEGVHAELGQVGRLLAEEVERLWA